MINTISFCVILLLWITDSFAQHNLKGLWNGHITTNGHNASANYIISIEEQKDGIISGKALLYKPNIYAEAFGLQQFFGTIPHRQTPTRWGFEVWQIDAAPAFRFTAHTQLKLQYTLKHGDSGTRHTTRALSAQYTLRF